MSIRFSQTERKATSEQDAKRRIIVEHLMNVGWKINHGYIDKNDFRKGEQDEDVVAKAVWGKYKGDYHLISPDKTCTIRVHTDKVHVWQKDPEWDSVAVFEIDNIKFSDDGIRDDVQLVYIRDGSVYHATRMGVM